MKTAIPADVRQLIVRQLGAALADAWRRQHQQDPDQRERVEELTGASATEGVSAPTVAV